MGQSDKVENAAQDATGRLKEAAGAITGNDELKAEGKGDQIAASAKEALENAKDRVSDGIDAIKDKLDGK